MSTRVIRSLLWKDWRLARPLLIAAGALYITPLIVGGIWLALPSNSDHPHTLSQWLTSAITGCYTGLIVSCLATPMFGAVMFARERRDRTVELVASMPVARGPIVFSKAVVLFALTALPWIVTILSIAALWLLIRSISGFEPNIEIHSISEATGGLFFPGAIALSIGSGWMFSAILSKDTLAAGLSFLVTMITIVQTLVIWTRLHPADPDIPHALLGNLTGGGGIACLITGTIIALRRKTP